MNEVLLVLQASNLSSLFPEWKEIFISSTLGPAFSTETTQF